MFIGDRVRIVNGFNPSFSSHTPRIGEEGILVAIDEQARGGCTHVVRFPSYTSAKFPGVEITNPTLSFYPAEIQPVG